MFEAAANQIKHKMEQVSHTSFDHLSVQDEIRAGAALALGAAAYAVAERVHMPQTMAKKAAAEVAALTGVKEVAAVATSTKELSAAEWLKTLSVDKVAQVLSPHIAHAEGLSDKLRVALHEEGDVTENIAKALNAHSREHFPYVKPINVETAPADDAFMHAQGNTIFIHDNLEHAPSGAMQLEYKSPQAEGEGGLVAALGHEYTHVEQTNFIQFAHHNADLTEGQYQRGLRLVDSLQKNSPVDLQVLNAENEFYSLRAVDFAGRKAMKEANALKPANFAPYFDSVVNFPAEDMPPSFKAFVDKQIALRSSILPSLSDHDVGRQMFYVLRGQIATAKSRALMTYNVYQNLYHEKEAFLMEDAIKGVYGKVHWDTKVDFAP